MSETEKKKNIDDVSEKEASYIKEKYADISIDTDGVGKLNAGF